jgi:hypothetical protein
VPTRIAGAVLVVFGFIALIVGGVPYRSTKQVAVLGDMKMEVKEEKQLTIPPFVSGIAILAGAVLLVRGGGKPAS